MKNPRHISPQCAHRLKPLEILMHFFRRVSMHLIPVLRPDDRHAINGEVLIQLVECGRRTASATAHHRCGGFPREILSAGVKNAIHEGRQRPRRSRIMNRRAENEAVRLSRQLRKRIHAVVFPKAHSVFATETAADAARDGGGTDLKDFRFDFQLIQNVRCFAQSGVRAAVGVRTAVNEEDFHDFSFCKNEE